MVDSPGYFGWLLQALPSGFRHISLIFPRGKTTERPVVFIDVRRAKNEDRLIGLSMLLNLEMCPFSSCFLSWSSWCSLASTFLFIPIVLLCLLCNAVHRTCGKEFIHDIYYKEWDGVSSWETLIIDFDRWPNWQDYTSRMKDWTSISLERWSALAEGWKRRIPPLYFIFLSLQDILFPSLKKSSPSFNWENCYHQVHVMSLTRL